MKLYFLGLLLFWYHSFAFSDTNTENSANYPTLNKPSGIIINGKHIRIESEITLEEFSKLVPELRTLKAKENEQYVIKKLMEK